MARLEADVAGVRVAVSASGEWLSRTLSARYERFPALRSGATAVEVRVVDHGANCPADSDAAYRAMNAAPFVDGLPDYPLLVERTGSRLDVTSLHLRGWIDLATGRGEALSCTHDQGAAENFLRVAVARLLLPEGGFLLHACAVVSGGEAFVGFGPSGAGKTTLAGLAGSRPVLSDDLVVLRRDGAGRLCAIPTLFRDGGAPPREGGYPVRRLMRLRKSPVAEVRGPLSMRVAQRPLDHLEGARELLAAMPYLVDDPESADGALALADTASERPGVTELTFPIDAGVWATVEGS